MKQQNGNLILLGGAKGSGKGLTSSYLVELGYQEFSFASRLKKLISELYGFDYNKLLGLTPEDRIWREQLNDLSSAPRHSFIWSFDSVAWSLSFVHPPWSLLNNSSDYLPSLSNSFSRVDLVNFVLARIKSTLFYKDLSPRSLMQIIGTDIFRFLSEDIWCTALYSDICDKLDTKIVISDGRFKNEALWAKNLGFKIIFIDRNLQLLDTHSSEYLQDFKSLADFVISNNGSPAQLKMSLLSTLNYV
jgi:hypothetical protein